MDYFELKNKIINESFFDEISQEEIDTDDTEDVVPEKIDRALLRQSPHVSFEFRFNNLRKMSEVARNIYRRISFVLDAVKMVNHDYGFICDMRVEYEKSNGARIAGPGITDIESEDDLLPMCKKIDSSKSPVVVFHFMFFFVVTEELSLEQYIRDMYILYNRIYVRFFESIMQMSFKGKSGGYSFFDNHAANFWDYDKLRYSFDNITGRKTSKEPDGTNISKDEFEAIYKRPGLPYINYLCELYENPDMFKEYRVEIIGHSTYSNANSIERKIALSLVPKSEKYDLGTGAMIDFVRKRFIGALKEQDFKETAPNQSSYGSFKYYIVMNRKNPELTENSDTSNPKNAGKKCSIYLDYKDIHNDRKYDVYMTVDVLNTEGSRILENGREESFHLLSDNQLNGMRDNMKKTMRRYKDYAKRETQI